jgi:uncharacterized glyoxalase superfamily protein PhnB
MQNRSVPPNTLLPHVVYEDVAKAIEWLSTTFGFTEHYQYGDPVSGAQLHLGGAYVMIVGVRPDRVTPAQAGHATQMLTVFIEDVDAHYARTKAAGANIWEELHETVYGERQYGVEDVAGHPWLFSQHVRDLSPDEWGATIAPVSTRS